MSTVQIPKNKLNIDLEPDPLTHIAGPSLCYHNKTRDYTILKTGKGMYMEQEFGPIICNARSVMELFTPLLY